jgi:hypothetical protein
VGATKKRRQTKHRGNAAGMVEARGRTAAPGRTGTAANGKGSGPRTPKPPSWSSASVKALIPLVLLAGFLLLTQKDKSASAILPLAVIAYVAYVPISYLSDRWVYNRYVKRGR